MAGARLGLIAASLLAVVAIGCGWTAQRCVASNAQIVFMAPMKASSLGKRGYELVTMNLDGSNRPPDHGQRPAGIPTSRHFWRRDP